MRLLKLGRLARLGKLGRLGRLAACRNKRSVLTESIAQRRLGRLGVGYVAYVGSVNVEFGGPIE